MNNLIEIKYLILLVIFFTLAINAAESNEIKLIEKRKKEMCTSYASHDDDHGCYVITTVGQTNCLYEAYKSYEADLKESETTKEKEILFYWEGDVYLDFIDRYVRAAKEESQAFRKYRDATCKMVELSFYTGSGAEIAYFRCMSDMTAKRVMSLAGCNKFESDD